MFVHSENCLGKRNSGKNSVSRCKHRGEKKNFYQSYLKVKWTACEGQHVLSFNAYNYHLGSQS